MPSSPSRQDRLSRLIAKPFAHRGLHGPGRVENSRAAFEAAIAAGHGIELDVRAIMYGEAIVFHDDRLDRLTDHQGPVHVLELVDLEQVRLKGSDETIPTLSEILALVGGKAPLLVELKAPRRDADWLSPGVAAALSRYKGPAAVMSFNPEVSRWFARHAPNVLRGLVVTEQDKGLRGLWERPLSLWWAKPDFLAYDIRDLPSRFAAAAGLPVLTWTVRSQDDRARAAQFADQIIFEAFPA